MHLQLQSYYEKLYTFGLKYIKKFLSIRASLTFEPDKVS